MRRRYDGFWNDVSGLSSQILVRALRLGFSQNARRGSDLHLRKDMSSTSPTIDQLRKAGRRPAVAYAIRVAMHGGNGTNIWQSCKI